MPLSLTRRHAIAAVLAAIATGAQAQGRPYLLSPEGSRITFVFTTGSTRQSGTVPVETADIVVDTGDLVRSSATVTADIRRISADLPFVAQAIKSAELLDAAQYPIVTFRSRRIRLGARGRISDGAEIDGDLTLRGVTRPITLQAQLTRPAGSAPDDLSVLYIQLNGSLSRRDFGAVGYAGMAGDRVDLDIRAEIRARA
jgi:polyisoprenoid-binding protein YceI